MSNLSIDLPAPAADGAGAWTDVSTLGALKTIGVGAAATVVAQFTIEISNEAVATDGQPIKTIQNRGSFTMEVAAHWMRVVVSGYVSGVPNVDVGGANTGCSFANLAVAAVNGAGASTDVTALGNLKTITIGGTWDGSVLIEGSEDNANFFPMPGMLFTGPGQKTLPYVATHMRTVRAGASSGTPIVNVGADNASGNNPFPNFENPQIIRYTSAAGGESDFNVAIPVARLNDAYSVFPALAGVASIVGIDCPDILAGDRTTALFRVITSAALTAGDIIDFLLAGR